MLYHLFVPLSQEHGVFNVFRYITFRSLGAVLTALLLSLLFGKPLIEFLKRLQKNGQPIRDDGPSSHLITKIGTPTMGGVLILGTTIFSTLLWGNLSNAYLWMLIFITTGFGILGGIDDYLKLKKRSHDGLNARNRILFEVLLVTIFCWMLIKQNGDLRLFFPFFKDICLYLGILFIPWLWLVIVGSANAVNLTDGLDGLAIVPVIITATCLGLIAYLAGHSVFSNYLQLPFIENAGELTIFASSIIGAGLGFLWFNAPPAKIFMGDTGSLAMGGALGSMSVIIKHEVVLVIIGGLFVIEALSVILQVGYFKITRKRIFLMAPIHHHFEKKGWSEPTVVIRFWIISTVLALLGLATLKLR